MRNLLKKFMVLVMILVISPNGIQATSAKSQSPQVIVIDPGHGGFDPGKLGVNGEDEKHLNLKISLILRDYLELAGFKVIMTRTSDDDVDGMDGVKHKSKDMVERKKIADKGDILVSIHQNSFTQPSVHGAQVFYSKGSEEGKRLAIIIQNKIKESVDLTNKRKAKSNKNYYVLNQSKIPAVIIECGFLTNAEEEAKLNNTAYQKSLALAIYLSILEYFDGSNTQCNLLVHQYHEVINE